MLCESVSRIFIWVLFSVFIYYQESDVLHVTVTWSELTVCKHSAKRKSIIEYSTLENRKNILSLPTYGSKMHIQENANTIISMLGVIYVSYL